MKIEECKRRHINNIGFVDPDKVHHDTVRDNPNESEANLLMSGGWPPIGSREAKSTKSRVDSAESKVDSAGPRHPWAESQYQYRLREKSTR